MFNDLTSFLFALSAVFQLAAMVFAVKMMKNVNDRRPWIVLLAALTIMFVFRCLLQFTSSAALGLWIPISALITSVLLFISLFYIRKIADHDRETENRYRALVELSPDAIFVNSKDKIVYINPAGMNFFAAKNVAELLGKSPLSLISPASNETIKARMLALDAGAKVLPPVAEKWIRLDGKTIDVEAASAVIPWEGGTAIQIVLRDISERIAAEEEKGRLLASERIARTNAEAANRTKDEFLATLSHELRTPLNAILGWAQLLRSGMCDQNDLTQGLETIERNARSQTQLIEDLLDMSRIISGKLRLEMQRISPVGFVTAALDAVRPAAEAKGIDLQQIIEPHSCMVSGDPDRLQQVMWNLLNNAVKFTPRGGAVTVRLHRVDSHVELNVSDTGQGIAPEFLPHVFERFRQADASTTRRFGGLGLGLSIVKQLVDMHGGTVTVTSRGEQRGSVFTVTLPVLAVKTADIAPQPSLKGSAVAQVNLSGLKVLVVDDEPDARELIRRVLAGCEAQVTMAGSAQEGLSKLDSADLLIADVGMPDVDGYEFLKRVRSAANRSAKIPAIALTAFARTEDRTRALMSGFQVHLAKPVSSAELIATVASLSGRTGITAQ